MPKVKVWNDNVYPYSETFKGDKIHIPAKQCIEMEEEDAISFRGTFSPPVRDADGNDTPAGYKMIRIEGGGPAAQTAKTAADHVCQLCKEKFQTESSLILHSEHAHKDQIVVDEAAEAAIRTRKAKAS
jgi:hypothetical protein